MAEPQPSPSSQLQHSLLSKQHFPPSLKNPSTIIMSNNILLSGLLILAFVQAIAGISHHHHHHDHQSAVMDTDGNEIQAGMAYYIVSAVRGGSGGGLSVARRDSSTSEGHTVPTVKQSSYDRNMGTPVRFSPASSELELQQRKDSAAGVRFLAETEEDERTPIRESMDMNLRFSGIENRVWQVEDRRDQSSGSSLNSSLRYVTLKGKPGHPGQSTVRNWFRIERLMENNPIYRIAYCPSVCDSCHVVCGRVGITQQDGRRWLSVSENREFPFVFVRARHTHENDE